MEEGIFLFFCFYLFFKIKKKKSRFIFRFFYFYLFFFEFIFIFQKKNKKAFVEPILSKEESKKRIRVVTQCKVLKVVFEGKRATGVEVEVDSRRIILKPKKEIILSAGYIKLNLV